MLIALLSHCAQGLQLATHLGRVRTDLSAGQDEAKAGRDRPLAAGAISRVAHSITQPPPANVDPQPPSYMAALGWGWAKDCWATHPLVMWHPSYMYPITVSGWHGRCA